MTQRSDFLIGFRDWMGNGIHFAAKVRTLRLAGKA